MEPFLTTIHIVIATSVGFLVGALWYSPLLFIKAWMKGEGVTQGEMKKPTKLYMAQTSFYSLIAHGSMASLLAIMFDLLSVNSLKVAVSLGLLFSFGFIVTTRFIDMIYTVGSKHYEPRPQIKFLVSSGYYLTVMAVMSAVIFLVSSR